MQVESIQDGVQACCQRIADLNLDGFSDQQKAEFKKRKLIVESYVHCSTIFNTCLRVRMMTVVRGWCDAM